MQAQKKRDFGYKEGHKKSDLQGGGVGMKNKPQEEEQLEERKLQLSE